MSGVRDDCVNTDVLALYRAAFLVISSSLSFNCRCELPLLGFFLNGSLTVILEMKKTKKFVKIVLIYILCTKYNV